MTGSNVRHSARGRRRQRRGDARRGGRRRCGRSRRSTATTRTRPAASTSSADDMAKWMRVLLAGGQLADGSRLFSERDRARADDARDADAQSATRRPSWRRCVATSAGTRSGSSVARLSRPQDADAHGRPAGLRVAGRCWFPTRPRRGRAHQPGVGEAFNAITYRVLDHYLGAPRIRLAGGATASVARASARAATAEQTGGRRPATPPRSRRCRSTSTPARIRTPGTATSRSPGERASSSMRFTQHAVARRATWSTGSTTRSSRAGAIASCAPTRS